MSRYTTASHIVTELLGQQNTVAIPLALVRLTGDYAAAAFLAQCVYWGARTSDAEGWFYKTHEEWQAELHLSGKQIRRCVEACTGIVFCERRGIPARNHYRVDMTAFIEALCKQKAQQDDLICPKGTTVEAQRAQPEVPSGQQPDMPKGHNSLYRNKDYTETTYKDYKQQPAASAAVSRTPLESSEPPTPTPLEEKELEPKKPASQEKQPQGSKKVPGAAGAGGKTKAKPEPTGFQRMFGALALACVGGAEGLTTVAKGRIGRAARSLLAAGYSDGDIAKIHEWIKHKDPWRTNITCEILEGEAPKWLAQQKSQPAAAPHASSAIAPPPGEYSDQRANPQSSEYDPRFDHEHPDYDPKYVLSAYKSAPKEQP